MMRRSFTQWSIFSKCGAQFKHRYVDRIRSEQAPAAARGDTIHNGIEKFMLGDDSGLDALPESAGMYVPYFHQLRDLNAVPEMKVLLCEDWSVPPDGERPERGITGKIDLVLVREEDSTGYFWEWKSGNVYDDHIHQKHFYSTALFSMFPHLDSVKGTALYLDRQKTAENTYERSAYTAGKMMWRSRLKQLDKPGAMVPNPGYYCTWCPYSNDKGGPCRFNGGGAK